MFKSIFISTTIPYVNAPPHVGFALELVQADTLARYHRLGGADVRFQTGTDENAFKDVLSARLRGIPVQQLVDENSTRFRSLTKLLNVSVDRFVRTTDPGHCRAVSELLSRLNQDDVYRRSYQGLYCAGCEDFYAESELVNGRCPEHDTPVLEVSEENVFFRLSRYQKQLCDLIATRRLRIVPETRELEVLRFVERGLVDISISRDARRCDHWGIAFPGDPTQVVYVWIDALINYLSGVGYPDDADFRRYWHDAASCHVIGKNVWKFHAVYWPALLLSAGLPLPHTIFVHGFLTTEGKKISKSAGGAIDPGDYVARVGVDALRWFLLRHVHPWEDRDFTLRRLEEVYRSDLVNGLGNLVSRVSALCAGACLPGLARRAPSNAPHEYHEHLATFRFDLALATVQREVAEANRELAEAHPWEDIAAGRQAEARATLAPFVERLFTLAHWLSPFLPSTSETIRQRLLEPVITKGAPLFPRIR